MLINSKVVSRVSVNIISYSPPPPNDKKIAVRNRERKTSRRGHVHPKADSRTLLVSSRTLYLYLHTIFDQRRLDIIDQVEYGVHDILHIYFPWHKHQIEGTNGL